MATVSLKQAQVYNWVGRPEGFSVGGNGRLDFVEAASQTFAKDQALLISSSAVAIQTVASNKFDVNTIGFACAKATGTTGTPVRFIPWMQGVIYALSVTNGGSAAASAISQIGSSYNMDLSSGLTVLNVGGTTSTLPRMRVVGMHPADTIGDSGARVLCVVDLATQAYFGVLL